MDDMVVIYYMYLVQMGIIASEMPEMRTRRWAVRPINRDRNVAGYYKKTFSQIKKLDDAKFFIRTRMSKSLFNLLLTLLGSSLSRPRQRISIEERLSITLLFLAHSTSLQSIASSYKIGKSTARKIILETCEELWRVLSPIYLSSPTTSEYKDIEADFRRMWHMPNCVGAIDGKHIPMKCPKNSGSCWYNYKKYFSMVVMAVCDARYIFTDVSVGSYGSKSDAGVFRLSEFGKALLANTLPLPANKSLPNCENPAPFPHYFVADAAFHLTKNIMKPIAPGRAGEMLDLKGKVFNYRLSRARRTIENAFGILAARWRILNTTLEFMPENCESFVLACIVLHNFIMLNDKERLYCPETYVDRDAPDSTTILGDWRNDVGPNGRLKNFVSHMRRSSKRAHQIRDELCRYFSAEGAVPFQPTA